MNVRGFLLAALCVFGCSSSSTESSSGVTAPEISGTWTAIVTEPANGGSQTTENYVVFGTGGTMDRYTEITLTSGDSSTGTVECASGPYSLSGSTLAYTLDAKDFQGTAYRIDETANVTLLSDKLTVTRNVDARANKVVYERGSLPEKLGRECPK